jgi:hypothetical protein
LYFIHTPDKQLRHIHCSRFRKNYIKSINESNLITNHNEYPIEIKSFNVSVLTNKSQWISFFNQIIGSIHRLKHIEYPTYSKIIIQSKDIHQLIEY